MLNARLSNFTPSKYTWARVISAQIIKALVIFAGLSATPLL